LERPIVFSIPVVLTVLGTVAYHVAQKTMPRPLSPFLLLAISFFVATIVCLVLLLSTTRPPFSLWHHVGWSNLALGLSVVTIETGYLIAYRMGWKLNRTALFSNVCVAILLIPLGTVVFREQVSLRMLTGAFFCIVGLTLLAK
jgi:drug/metabolite transporter (DMT)-like permease